MSGIKSDGLHWGKMIDERVWFFWRGNSSFLYSDEMIDMNARSTSFIVSLFLFWVWRSIGLGVLSMGVFSRGLRSFIVE